MGYLFRPFYTPSYSPALLLPWNSEEANFLLIFSLVDGWYNAVRKLVVQLCTKVHCISNFGVCIACLYVYGWLE